MALNITFPTEKISTESEAYTGEVVLKMFPEDTGLKFEVPLTFSLGGGSEIIKREVSKGRLGSIKERWATKDIEISFEGLFPQRRQKGDRQTSVGLSNQYFIASSQSITPTYDIDSVAKFREYMDHCNLILECDMLNRVGIFNIVVSDWELDTPTAFNQPFSFEATSNDTNNYLLEDV